MEHGTYPGGLGAVRDLVRTWDAETQSDMLLSPLTARGWLGSVGIPKEATPQELELLRNLRGVLAENLLANAGHGDRPAAWAKLRPYAEGVRLRVVLGEEPRLASIAEGVEGYVAGLMATVYDAVRAGTWGRLKLCREECCAVPFYDESKNGSGVWCSMGVCGNRNKARRRRERERAAGASSADQRRST